MIRNVVRAASARLGASLAIGLVALAPAWAGDRANIDFIGYSEDGRYFAFEEYGVHDGSGGNYSHIYVVDLPADKWVKGAPFSVEEGGDMAETPPLAATRARAMAKADKTLEPLKLTTGVAIMALLGDGVAGADGKRMDYADPACCEPGRTDEHGYRLTLATFPARLDEDYCADMHPVGFELDFGAGEQTIVLHKDGATLPKSRGCTVDYRLYAVVTPFEGKGMPVAIVSSYPFGFEGPDRRFLAVPIDTP